MPPDSCAKCGDPLGDFWWQDVPGEGDLCDPCHEIWVHVGRCEICSEPRPGGRFRCSEHLDEADEKGDP